MEARVQYPTLFSPTFTVLPPPPTAPSSCASSSSSRSDEENDLLESMHHQQQQGHHFIINVAWKDHPSRPFGFLALPSPLVTLRDARDALFDQIDQLAIHKDSYRKMPYYNFDDTLDEDSSSGRPLYELRFMKKDGVAVGLKQEETLLLADIQITKKKYKTSSATTTPLILLHRTLINNNNKKPNSGGATACSQKKRRTRICCLLFLLALVGVAPFLLWPVEDSSSSSYPSTTTTIIELISPATLQQQQPQGDAPTTTTTTTDPGADSENGSTTDTGMVGVVVVELGDGGEDNYSDAPAWLAPLFRLMRDVLRTLTVLMSQYFLVLEYMFSDSNPCFLIIQLMREILQWYFQTFQYCWWRTADLIAYTVDRSLNSWPVILILVAGLQGACFWVWRMQVSCGLTEKTLSKIWLKYLRNKQEELELSAMPKEAEAEEEV